MTPSLPIMVLVMTAAALFCRFAGYAAMKYLPPSHRLDAALKATPLAVMAGITAQALAAGGLVEAIAIAAVMAIALISRSDIGAAIAGVAIAAALRAFGL